MTNFKTSRRFFFIVILSTFIIVLTILLWLKNHEILPKSEPTAIESSLTHDAKSPLNISEHAFPITTSEAKKLVQTENPNNGAEYISIDNSGLPLDEINTLKRDFDNLKKLGSYSGGKMTHEFAQTTYFRWALLKNGGLNHILAKLNFMPINIGTLLGEDFKLIGADYSGAFNKGKFNSIFQSYESRSGKKVEINEMYLNPDNNVRLSIYIESINFDLLGHPATFQHLTSADDKDIFDLDFNINKRAFSISSEGLSHDEFLQLAVKIAKVANKNSVKP